VLTHGCVLCVFCSLLCSNCSFYVFCYWLFACVLYDLFSVLCILWFCIVLCIVSPDVYSRSFFLCVQVYRQLPPGGKPVAVNDKYYVNLI
jgi:hypothetical protein